MGASDKQSKTLARGMAAGLAGTAVMTAFQRFVEMPLSGRDESEAPAKLDTKLLPIGPKGRRQQRQLNYGAHFAVGSGWGVAPAWSAEAACEGSGPWPPCSP